eukprot:TRINITY_DN54463_c0_g1_i1.p1 TRINITY_DN54463_c0_g1~~TRINITY_DN54463_c0_g1_i1.p1  ORF type:complete len:445 (-),score=81.80 TRINITY_DN54463_c0_g1_i1:42-1376(-)
MELRITATLRWRRLQRAREEIGVRHLSALRHELLRRSGRARAAWALPGPVHLGLQAALHALVLAGHLEHKVLIGSCEERLTPQALAAVEQALAAPVAFLQCLSDFELLLKHGAISSITCRAAWVFVSRHEQKVNEARCGTEIVPPSLCDARPLLRWIVAAISCVDADASSFYRVGIKIPVDNPHHIDDGTESEDAEHVVADTDEALNVLDTSIETDVPLDESIGETASVVSPCNAGNPFALYLDGERNLSSRRSCSESSFGNISSVEVSPAQSPRGAASDGATDEDASSHVPSAQNCQDSEVLTHVHQQECEQAESPRALNDELTDGGGNDEVVHCGIDVDVAADVSAVSLAKDGPGETSRTAAERIPTQVHEVARNNDGERSLTKQFEQEEATARPKQKGRLRSWFGAAWAAAPVGVCLLFVNGVLMVALALAEVAALELDGR